MKKGDRSSRVRDKGVVNVLSHSSELSLNSCGSQDENDFLFVQANDIDKESIHFQIQNEDQRSVHWTISAGHEPSVEIQVKREVSAKELDSKFKDKKTPIIGGYESRKREVVSLDEIDVKVAKAPNSDDDRGILDNNDHEVVSDNDYDKALLGKPSEPAKIKVSEGLRL